MILSASGWRMVFAPDGEHGSGTEPDHGCKLLAVGMGVVWGQWLIGRFSGNPVVLVASDTRPTGPILAEMVMRGLESLGCYVRYAGVAAAPETMARSGRDPDIDGFAYISASHNPLGHNGIKFGIGGGVIGGAAAKELMENYRRLIKAKGTAKRLTKIAGEAALEYGKAPRTAVPEEKRRCREIYRAFLEEIAEGVDAAAEQGVFLNALRRGLREQPLCIIADLNGSARCSSVDSEYLESLGADFQAFNTVPGIIAHDILPEGEALEPCRMALEKAHAWNSAALVGYVPDNDGDRGNLVIWDETLGAARSLEAQEVFALTVLAELASMAWMAGAAARGTGSPPGALVVNGPTSHRVREIAAVYSVEVHEAEVGEANIVNRASELRQEGYRVRCLGEGSNGGSIIHPAAVRDPLNTVTALLKLLRLPASGNRPGPFEDWCQRTGRPEAGQAGFGPADIIAALPRFTTTPASALRAKMSVETRDQGALKAAWEEIFRRQWSLKKKELAERFGFTGWVEINNEGTASRTGMGRAARTGDESGGLKVVFRNDAGDDCGFLWMRGSGTEPVFRVMAEVRGHDEEGERELIEWLRDMVAEADRRCTGLGNKLHGNV